MIFEIMLVIVLVIMSIELCLVERKIKTIKTQLDKLLKEVKNGNSSSFGTDVAGDHDY